MPAQRLWVNQAWPRRVRNRRGQAIRQTATRGHAGFSPARLLSSLLSYCTTTVHHLATVFVVQHPQETGLCHLHASRPVIANQVTSIASTAGIPRMYAVSVATETGSPPSISSVRCTANPINCIGILRSNLSDQPRPPASRRAGAATLHGICSVGYLRVAGATACPHRDRDGGRGEHHGARAASSTACSYG